MTGSHDQPPVVDERQAQHDREPVQPRQIAAHDEHELEHDRDERRDGRERCGREIEERHDELDDVVERDARAMDRRGHPVEVPAQRVRHRLSFEVVVEAGEIAPARVAAQLDQTRAEHDAEQQPRPEPRSARRTASWCVRRERSPESRLRAAATPSQIRRRSGRRSRTTDRAPTAGPRRSRRSPCPRRCGISRSTSTREHHARPGRNPEGRV